MKKINKLILLPLLALPLISCNQDNEIEEKVEERVEVIKYQDNEIVMLNDFENYSDLSHLRILNADFSFKSKFDLNDDSEYVTHGSKSMSAISYVGTSFTFQVFLDDANIPVENRYDFKTVNLDIYNATDKDSDVFISVNMGDKNDSLLRGEFVAKKGEWTNISYALSAMALEYNYDKIRAIAVTFKIPLNQKMYFDNFSLTAGAKITQEDEANKGHIDEIASMISNLPEFVSESDYETMVEIYDKYVALPDLYRRIVPNFDVFKQKATDYYTGFVASKPLSSDQKFLFNDEFFGIIQYQPINGSNIEFNVVNVPDDPKFESIESEKWMRVSLLDTANNMITAKGIVEKTNEYETISFSAYNDGDTMLRIWFNYANMCFVDIKPYTLATVEMSTALFNNAQSYWAIHHVIDGQIVAIKSDLYLTPFVLHRMSEEDILKNMLENFNKLPDPASLVDDDSITPYIDIISKARFYYEKGNDTTKDTLTLDQLNKLIACESASNGYGIIYYSAQQKYSKWYYGMDFEATSVIDDTYGEVCKCSLTGEGSNLLTEQYFGSMVNYDSSVLDSYGRFKVSVYNPTNSTITVYFKDSKWANWDDEMFNCFIEIPANSWGSLVLDIDYLSYNNSDCTFVIQITSSGDLTGDYLISSVYGLPAEE